MNVDYRNVAAYGGGMSGVVQRGKLAGWLLVEVGVVVVLHRLGAQPWLQIPWHDLPRWMQTAPPEDVIGAVLRLVGLAVGYWLLASTALYALARLSRFPAAIRAAGWMTLPVVRRVADQAIAFGLAASIVTSVGATAAAAAVPSNPNSGRPVAAVQQVAVPMSTRPQPPQAGLSTPTSTTSQPSVVVTTPRLGRTTPSPAVDRRGVSPATADAPQRPVSQHTHTVVAGDNLWRIAAATLAAASGQQPEKVAAAEIVPYWQRLIAANQGRLRSGDPDLIYPGEVVILPPLQPGS
jgi:LysM repeat protein